MIDFHTHILPELDDGSKNVEQSLSMLSALKEQGVKTVIATPHFYAGNESVESFIQRRKKSVEKLSEKGTDLPEIMLGAEVRYYEGISRLEDLEKLRIEGTRFLLLEMPFDKWSGFSINEVLDIAGRGKITLVLAHIDRYIGLQKKEVFRYLLENGVLFQFNASFFGKTFSKRKALKLLINNSIHFIGSDCHNMSDRAPNMKEALDCICKKYGKEFLDDYINYGNEMFSKNKIK